MNSLQAIAAPVGRILISLMFVTSGLGKIAGGAYALDNRKMSRS